MFEKNLKVNLLRKVINYLAAMPHSKSQRQQTLESIFFFVNKPDSFINNTVDHKKLRYQNKISFIW